MCGMSTRSEVLALCIERAGYRRGAQVCQFVWEWELYVRSTQSPGEIEAFSTWWKDSRTTAYRRLVAFREAFPELGEQGTPNDLMGPLLAALEAGENLDSVEAAYAVPA